MKELTQAERILKVLQEKNGEWINGRYFNSTMMISQFHTRIHELQKRGHNIQPSNFTDEYGFKSYRLISEALPMQQASDCCPSYKIFKVHARDCSSLKAQTLL